MLVFDRSYLVFFMILGIWVVLGVRYGMLVILDDGNK